jgi:hypothetical protein
VRISLLFIGLDNQSIEPLQHDITFRVAARAATCSCSSDDVSHSSGSTANLSTANAGADRREVLCLSGAAASRCSRSHRFAMRVWRDPGSVRLRDLEHLADTSFGMSSEASSRRTFVDSARRSHEARMSTRDRWPVLRRLQGSTVSRASPLLAVATKRRRKLRLHGSRLRKTGFSSGPRWGSCMAPPSQRSPWSVPASGYLSLLPASRISRGETCRVVPCNARQRQRMSLICQRDAACDDTT